jgi:hypothetical protein
LSPEEVLTYQVQEFNKGNTDFLMALYEKEVASLRAEEKLTTI